MKIIQSKIVISIMLVLFIGALIWVYFCGNAFGILQNEIPLTITNAILMLLATFIAISLPLYANAESERQKKNEELKASYIAIARYVGEELSDNIVRIEDLMSNNKITFEELDKKFANASEKDKSHQQVGIWKAVAEDLLNGLEDINHRSLIMSGILTKVPDNEMNSEIKNAYSKMINLKQRLRRLSIFFGMILTPPPNFPPQVVSDVLKTKVPLSIKTSQEDIDIFLDSAKEAIKKINEMIKPYDKELKTLPINPRQKLTMDIFEEAKIQAEKLLSLLREGNELLPKRLVPRELLRQRFTVYRGIIAPIKSVSHKYLFDDFEAPFLEAYIALFGKLIEERSSTLNEFSFRTLLEMGSEDSFIILDKRVYPDDKKIFILVSLLADYSSIETSMRSVFNTWLTKLFDKHKAFIKQSLPPKDFSSLNELKELLNQTRIDLDRFTVLLKEARELRNKVKANILNKYKQKKVFALNDMYKRMKSGESHMLHGNAFLIINRINQQSVENHLFRVFAYLTISGTDMLNRLSGFLGNKSYSQKVDAFNTEHSDFKNRFKLAWEKSRPIK